MTPRRILLPALCLAVLCSVPPACRSKIAEDTLVRDAAATGGGLEGKLDDQSIDAVLAQAGVSLADLSLPAPMPGDAPPPDDGLLPASLPEYIPGLDDTTAVAEQGSPEVAAVRPGDWHRSGVEAIRQARRQQRPLVVWLANTQSGPLDTMLGNDVLQTPATVRMLADQAVALRIDYGNEVTRKSSYYLAFRQRYRIKGHPTLLILMPDGTEVARHFGYVRGTAEARADNLARDVRKAADAWQRRRQDLKRYGFRDWTDRNGGVFFAKALRRSGQEAVMIDPFRRIYRVPLARFAHEQLVDLLDAVPTAVGTGQ